MAELWHSCIGAELDRVEDLMVKLVHSENPELTEMCNYVLRSQGKRVRPAVCVLSFFACGGKDPTKAVEVGTALEIIHNATLIHDDINDHGDLRRGAKALYREYTLSKSIVAGDYLFAQGFRLMGGCSHEIVNFVVDASSLMGAGEFNQKDFEHKDSVGEAEYIKIIEGKTASFMVCAAKSGAFLSSGTMEHVDALGRFAENMGLAFQIMDDILDVVGDENVTGKNVGNDIMEGKPTLPTIYAMEDPVYGKRIREIFGKEDITKEEALEAVSLISKTESVGRCHDKAEAYIEKAISALSEISDSKYKEALSDLARYIVRRDR